MTVPELTVIQGLFQATIDFGYESLSDGEYVTELFDQGRVNVYADSALLALVDRFAGLVGQPYTGKRPGAAFQ